MRRLPRARCETHRDFLIREILDSRTQRGNLKLNKGFSMRPKRTHVLTTGLALMMLCLCVGCETFKPSQPYPAREFCGQTQKQEEEDVGAEWYLVYYALRFVAPFFAH